MIALALVVGFASGTLLTFAALRWQRLPGPGCPRCGARTSPVVAPTAVRLTPGLERRWCSTCSWEGTCRRLSPSGWKGGAGTGFRWSERRSEPRPSPSFLPRIRPGLERDPFPGFHWKGSEGAPGDREGTPPGSERPRDGA